MAEPTPVEDAAARAKEAEEQAALPYKWTQVISELDITFTVPGNFKSRDLVIEIKKNSLQAGIKGQEPLIKVRTLSLMTWLPSLPPVSANTPRATSPTPSTSTTQPGR